MNDFEQGQTLLSLTGNFTARYFLKRGKDPKAPLFVLLHGYSQTGEHFAEKIFAAFPSGAADSVMILSPNGPFPVPQNDGTAFRPGFSWYFYETKNDEYYVDMKLGVDYLRTLIDHLKLSSRPKILIGYSQGGYIVPFAAQALKNVERIIGINCQLLREEIEGSLPCPIDQIQGAEDKIVTPSLSRESFDKLKTRNPTGRYVEVPGAGHGLSAAILEELSKFISEAVASL